MKLSIIVPVYNVEPFLPQCLDTLVAQTIDDYEIILINDGSPDNSQSIIDDYQRRYPERIRSLIIDNGGQGRARNFGIEIARGEYIGFVDSDDWVSTEMFEKLYAAAKREDAEIVTCDGMAIAPDGSEEYLYTAVYKDLMHISGGVPNKLFRRSFIADIRFPIGIWYEDIDFVIKLIIKAQKVASVPECLYFYRLTPSSTMRNNNARKNLDIITVMDDLREYLRQNGCEEGYDTLVINHILFDGINRVAKQKSPEKNEVIAKLRAYVRNNIPNLFSCGAFKKEIFRRRLLMALNYYGLEKLSCVIYYTKKRLDKFFSR